MFGDWTKSRNRPSRSVAMLVLAMGIAGCTSILDIESAEVDDAGATGGSSGGSGGSAVGSPSGCELTGDPCMDCVATDCCAVYSACEADPECQVAMSVYNYCLQHPPTTGESCPELLAQFGVRALALTGCAFGSGSCAEACEAKTLDTTCSQYCDCMAEYCPDKTLPGGECVQICPTLTAAQVNCRTAHCIGGASNDPVLHCPHVAGEAVCP